VRGLTIGQRAIKRTSIGRLATAMTTTKIVIHISIA
jgi:hypothetical protein